MGAHLGKSHAMNQMSVSPQNNTLESNLQLGGTAFESHEVMRVWPS